MAPMQALTPNSTLSAAAALACLAIAATLCWFGFDGMRAGVTAGSELAVLAGFAFFFYGLAGTLLLVIAWVRGDPVVRRLAAVLALVTLALAVVSFAQEGFRRAEWFALLELTALVVLHVLALAAVVQGRRPRA